MPSRKVSKKSSKKSRRSGGKSSHRRHSASVGDSSKISSLKRGGSQKKMEASLKRQSARQLKGSGPIKSQKASLLKRQQQRRQSYGGSQLKRDLRSLERLLGGYSSTGGKAKPTGRYFTVHTVDGKDAKVVLKGETGRYEMTESGGPLSAARKAYTSLLNKLGLKSKGSSTELTFEMREVTQNRPIGGNPVYGPYQGIRVSVPEKARDAFMKKHGIKHRSIVHLLGKKNLKVGGSCGTNHDKPKRGGSKYRAKKQMRASLKGRRSSRKSAGALKSSQKRQSASLKRQHSSRKSAGSMRKTDRQRKASLKRSARQQQRQQMGGDFWSFFN